MIELRELVQAAVRMQSHSYFATTPFCIIGGLAVQRWSEPRFTRDVDATIFVGFGEERKAAKKLLKHYRARIDNALEFALLNRVLLVSDIDGCPLDLSLAGMPFESEMIERSTMEVIDPKQQRLRICGPSDLVILKAFAGRPQDWQDIRGTLIRCGDKLDWKLIEQELTVLLDLKEEPEAWDQLMKLKKETKSKSNPRKGK